MELRAPRPISCGHGALVRARVSGLAAGVARLDAGSATHLRNGGLSVRIVYLWDADYPWDVRTAKVCSALVRRGHSVEIVARNRAWKIERETLEEGTVHRLRPWRALGQRLDGASSFPAFFSPRWS